MVKPHDLYNSHFRFCLFHILSKREITWDIKVGNASGNCLGCVVKSWIPESAYTAKPECFTIMTFHDSQLFIQVSNTWVVHEEI